MNTLYDNNISSRLGVVFSEDRPSSHEIAVMDRARQGLLAGLIPRAPRPLYGADCLSFPRASKHAPAQRAYLVRDAKFQARS